MSISPFSEVMLHDDEFCKIATDLIQKYARANFEDSALFEVMKIDSELWTKENWETIDATTWMIIKQHCIPHGIWINHYGNKGIRAEILMRLVSMEYNADFQDWDMNRIRQVEKAHGKVSRGIQYRKQELLGNIPDQPQTTQ